MSKHIFAYYIKNLALLLQEMEPENFLQFKDPTLWNRIITITRTKAGEHFVLFDDKINVIISAHKSMLNNKRIIAGNILSQNLNVPLEPSITLLLSILKKDAMHAAVYAAAQMGVTEIVPVTTERGQGKWNRSNIEKIQQVMISACEQAKQFVLPTIQEAFSLKKYFEKEKKEDMEYRICFDEHGKPLIKFISEAKQSASKIKATLGPEGGFSKNELELLKANEFKFYKLTPTILRSRDAVLVGLGMLRSYF